MNVWATRPRETILYRGELFKFAERLTVMRDEAQGDDPEGVNDRIVTEMPSERDMSRERKRWLKKAGVTDPELHATTATTKGLTWTAVRGDEPLKFMQRRAVRADQLYVRAAENLREGFGSVFPPRPAGLSATKRFWPGSGQKCLNPAKTPTLRRNVGGADGTRTRGLRRDRPAL